MKIGSILTTIFCLILISCGHDSNTTEAIITENADQKVVINATTIQNLDGHRLSKDVAQGNLKQMFVVAVVVVVVGVVVFFEPQDAMRPRGSSSLSQSDTV